MFSSFPRQSTLVRTPNVLDPSLSANLAIWSPSELEMSELAGITQRMIVDGSSQ